MEKNMQKTSTGDVKIPSATLCSASILSARFYDMNGKDNISVIVDTIGEIVYENTKVDDKGEFFVKIYSSGLAYYGYTEYDDPIHGGRYTWSSCPSSINDAFELWGTPYQLAIYSIGYREFKSPYTCYCACGIVYPLAFKLACCNQKQLAHGLISFIHYNAAVKVLIAKPGDGSVFTLEDSFRLYDKSNKQYISIVYDPVHEVWYKLFDVADFVVEKHRNWCARDWELKTL